MNKDAQNVNHPLCVPANRKKFTAIIAQTQKNRFPIVSAILFIGDLKFNLKAKITTCNILIPTAKFDAAP